METIFRTSSMLTIIEIRRNPIFKCTFNRESLFLLGETSFLASGNHFFLHFSETLGSESFFHV